MKELHWLPLDAAAWLVRTAAMSPEAAAAYMMLRCHAWLASKRGEPACTVPSDPEELARLSGAGARWKKIAPKVLVFFEADGDRLLDADLFATWNEQQAAYERRANAGSKGGKAKAERVAKGKQAPSDGVALLQQSELDGVSPAPNGAGGDPQAPDGARAALTGSPAAGDDERGPAPTDGGPGLTAADAKEIRLTGAVRDFPLREYQERLAERVATWAERYPDRWQELVTEAGEQAASELGADAPPAVRDRLVQSLARESVRIERGWPSYEAWVADERARERRAQLAVADTAQRERREEATAA